MTYVQILRLDSSLPMPRYAHEGDAGFDLYARTSVALAAGGGRDTVPTGIEIAIEPGHLGLIVPRSGLASLHGVTVLNAPGIIDSGYRGELKVVLVNLDPQQTYTVSRGDRIAQLVIVPMRAVEIAEVAQLPAAVRGSRGFGQSGR